FKCSMKHKQKIVEVTFAAVAFVLAMVLYTALMAADDADESKTALPATPPLTKTVGVNIVKKTVNADKSWTLEFQWKDKNQQTISRSVVVNDGTVIGVDGKLKTLADVTDDVLKKKAVATVGPDDVTAVNLRFGRVMVAVTKDQLTPAQVAALEAAAPKATAAS